jgi:hypothetical protein
LWSKQNPKIGEVVTFDASDSSDNFGIVEYEWDFGDETTGMVFDFQGSFSTT